MPKKIIFIALFAVILGCNNPVSVPEPMLDEEFNIKVGQQVKIAEENITIQFKEVLEDSRCPEGVICFWAGNAKIRIALDGEKVTLNTYLDPKKEFAGNYEIKLIVLNPYPHYKVPVQPKEYVAKLVITKVSSLL